MKKIVIFTLIFLMAMGVASCTSSSGTQTDESSAELPIITTVTAPMGSGWHATTVLLSDIWMNDIPGLNVSVLEGGSVANIKAINEGVDANMGWAYTVDLNDAYNARGVFEEEYPDVRTMGVMWPVWLNIVTLEGSGIDSVEDFLNGAKINPGAVGTGSEIAAIRLLEAYGMTYDDIKNNGGSVSYGNYSDAATQVGDGIVDVMMGGGSPDIPAVHELALQNDIKLIPASEEALQKLIDLDYGYTVDTPIPANTYEGQTEDIPAVTYWSVMVVNKDVPEDVVYKMTKSIWDNIDYIRQEQPARGKYIQLETVFDGIDTSTLHPGAAKYYKEVGALK